MMQRDLPYNKSMRSKHAVELNFMKISTQILYIPLENDP